MKERAGLAWDEMVELNFISRTLLERAVAERSSRSARLQVGIVSASQAILIANVAPSDMVD